MKKKINLHVGYDPAASKARVLNAIRRAEAGSIVPENHVTFESWDGLARILSEKRLELLRHVRREPAATIAELARALGRDYKRVYEDVDILTNVGLIERSGDGIRAAYDEIRTSIKLVPAA